MSVWRTADDDGDNFFRVDSAAQDKDQIFPRFFLVKFVRMMTKHVVSVFGDKTERWDQHLVEEKITERKQLLSQMWNSSPERCLRCCCAENQDRCCACFPSQRFKSSVWLPNFDVRISCGILSFFAKDTDQKHWPCQHFRPQPLIKYLAKTDLKILMVRTMGKKEQRADFENPPNGFQEQQTLSCNLLQRKLKLNWFEGGQ